MERTEHDDQPTCGKGLAANAALPAKLSELISVQAEVLDRHTRALGTADEDSRTELAAYQQLAQAHRDVASQLARLSEAMASCRDLPMGQHDMAVMTDPNGQMEAFQRFVGVERELLAHLQAKLEAEEAMLG